MHFQLNAPAIVFLITLAATFAAAAWGRWNTAHKDDQGLSGQRLNKWLVGLSAGTAANSGFVVTAAVGLGYTAGLQWVLLPIAWLLGDIVFWLVFPGRINQFGEESKATTLSQILTHGLSGPITALMAILCAIIIVVCLTGYTSAQWLAGEKFLSGAFGFPDYLALGMFALLIVLYTAIGGFRGSIYTDAVQAIIRLVGTSIAIGAVIWIALDDPTFAENINAAGPTFFDPFGGSGVVAGIGFIAGYAAAAFGFGLGQPQIVARYLAGRNPQETRAAWWIYFGFVQYTWIAMTVFGMILRGVMPSIPDPEKGLSLFFETHMSPVLTGIIAADVFATIAATSNALLVAMAQAVVYDLVPGRRGSRVMPVWIASLLIGAGTMIVSYLIKGSVVSLALSSVSLMGAGLAPAVAIKVLRLPHSPLSLISAITVGIGSAVVWKLCGLGSLLNEAAIGIGAGFLVNSVVSLVLPVKGRDRVRA